MKKIPGPRKQCVENELQAFLEDLGYEKKAVWNMNGTLMMNFIGKLKNVKRCPKEAIHIEIVPYETWMEE